MDAQPSLEQLAAELRRRRLPQSYIDRLLSELRDHMEDVNTQRRQDMSTAWTPNVTEIRQRIGDPIQLAKFTAEQYHRRSFLGRHPVLTFVMLPLPILIATLIAVALGIWLSTWAIAWMLGLSLESRANPYMESLYLAVFCWILCVVPPLATVAFMCRLARRNQLSWRWPIAACLIVAFLCAIISLSYRLATNDHYIPDHPGNGQLMFGILPFWSVSLKVWMTWLLPRFVLALGVGLLLVRRAQRLAVDNPSLDEVKLPQAA